MSNEIGHLCLFLRYKLGIGNKCLKKMDRKVTFEVLSKCFVKNFRFNNLLRIVHDSRFTKTKFHFEMP